MGKLQIIKYTMTKEQIEDLMQEHCVDMGTTQTCEVYPFVHWLADGTAEVYVCTDEGVREATIRRLQEEEDILKTKEHYDQHPEPAAPPKSDNVPKVSPGTRINEIYLGLERDEYKVIGRYNEISKETRLRLKIEAIIVYLNEQHFLGLRP